MWRLLTFRDEDFANRTDTYIEAVGRLERGVTFDQARAELSMLAERLLRDNPETNAETGVSFFRMRDNMSPRSRLILMSLGGASLCLLPADGRDGPDHRSRDPRSGPAQRPKRRRRQSPLGDTGVFQDHECSHSPRVVRHAGQRDALVAAIRQIVRAADPEQPISDVRTMDEVLAGDTASRRTQLQVLGVLAAVAVLLSCVGIYGLLAYTVSQQSREIGVLGAYAAARGMSTLLFGVAPGDPVTFAAAVGVVLLVTFAGSVVPALRAVRVSPMSVLKAE